MMLTSLVLFLAACQRDADSLDEASTDPCLSGAPEDALFIVADAPFGGDGTFAAPFQDIYQAFDAVEPGQEIRVASGNYGYGLIISDPGRHRDVSVVGCGEEPPTIRGGLQITGASGATLQGVHIKNLTFLGGNYNVILRANDVSLVGIRIENPINTGLRIRSSVVDIDTLDIVSPGDTGLSVQEGAAVTLDALTVSEPVAAGLYINEASVEVGGLTVSGQREEFACIDMVGGELTTTGEVSLMDCLGNTVQILEDAVFTAHGEVSIDSNTNIGLVAIESTLTVEGTLSITNSWSSGSGCLHGRASTLTLGDVEMLECGGLGLVLYDETIATISGTLEIEDTVESSLLLQEAELWIEGETTIERPGQAAVYVRDAFLSLKGLAVTGSNPGYSCLYSDGAVVQFAGSSTLESCGDYGISADASTLSSDGSISITDSTETAVILSETSLTGTGSLTISDSGAQGVVVSTASTLEQGSLTISGSAENSSCLYATNADIQLDSASLTDCGGHGLALYEGTSATLSGDVTISAPVSTGVRISDSSLSSTGSLRIDDAAEQPIFATDATLSLGHVEVSGSGSGASCLYTEGTDIQLGSATVSGCGNRGISLLGASSAVLSGPVVINGVGGDGLGLNGASSLSMTKDSSLFISSPGADGIGVEEGSTLQARDVTIEDAGASGVEVSASALTLIGADIAGSGEDGILLVSPTDTVLLESVELTDSARAGVLVSGGSLLYSQGALSGNTYAAVLQDCTEDSEMTLEGVTVSGNQDDTLYRCESLTLELP